MGYLFDLPEEIYTSTDIGSFISFLQGLPVSDIIKKESLLEYGTYHNITITQSQILEVFPLD